jgi:type III secretion protein V
VYSILSIGDGMVAQIPALLSAMAAGLVVTRTTGQSSDRHLGAAIGRQLLAQPRPLVLTGLTALVMSAVPGFPSLVFLLLAAAAFLAGWSIASGRLGSTTSWGTALQAVQPAPLQATEPPIVIGFGADARAGAEHLGMQLGVACVALGKELGITMAAPLLRIDNSLPAAQCEVRLFDVVVGQADASSDLVSVYATAASELRRQAARFFGVQEASEAMQRLAQSHPALAKEVNLVLSAQQIADVLRRLLAESVPLRNLRDIMEALLQWAEREKDPAGLAEFVRIGIGRAITARHADAQRRLHAVIVDPEIERELRGACRAVAGTSMLGLAPDRSSLITARLASRIEAARRQPQPFVLLAAIDVRRHVRKLIESAHPELAVLSYQELVEPLLLVPVGGDAAPLHAAALPPERLAA